MKNVILACAMMEDELQQAYEKTGCQFPIHWVERGLHNYPQRLREELQKKIDSLQEYDTILMTYGLCGNGTAGLVSPRAALVLPQFDDCINLMLCQGKRKGRALTETDTIYLTRGWTEDEESVLQFYEKCVEEYGKEDAQMVLDTMYRHYKKISLINTGCYELGPVMEYAKKAGKLLHLEPGMVAGSNQILEKLLLGQWEKDFILQPPGVPLSENLWNITE